jgi:hypothetical protein
MSRTRNPDSRGPGSRESRSRGPRSAVRRVTTYVLVLVAATGCARSEWFRPAPTVPGAVVHENEGTVNFGDDRYALSLDVPSVSAARGDGRGGLLVVRVVFVVRSGRGSLYLGAITAQSAGLAALRPSAAEIYRPGAIPGQEWQSAEWRQEFTAPPQSLARYWLTYDMRRETVTAVTVTVGRLEIEGRSIAVPPVTFTRSQRRVFLGGPLT